MVFKIFLKQIFVLLLLYNSLILGQSSVLSKFRIFPELNNIQIRNIKYRNPSTIFIFTHDMEYLRWTGRHWQKIEFPLKAKDKNIVLFPYDSTHYVISYVPQERYYHSNLSYFDGQKWKEVSNPQPYIISTVSFLDKNRFWAGGLSGSLIFYDGINTYLERFPLIGDLSFINALGPRLFIALISYNIVNTEVKQVVKFDNGKWQKLFNSNRNFKQIYFWTADSGLLLDDKGSVFCFTGKNLEKIFDKTVPNVNRFVFNPKEKAGYFWAKKFFWKLTFDGNKKALFPFPEMASIYPIEDGYFLFFKEQLYYLGNKNLGQMVKLNKPKFYRRLVGMQNSMSVSIYQFQNQQKGLYFVVPMKINSFTRLKFSSGTQKISNDVLKMNEYLISSNLLDFKKNNFYWDAALALGDLDNDGDRDAVLSNLDGNCHFYENVGQDRFRDITSEINLAITGRINLIHLVDFNSDGNLDIVFGNEFGRLRFVINNGFMRFRDVTNQIKISKDLLTYMPAFADLDGDGDADLIAYSVNNPIRYYENVGVDASNNLPLFAERSERSPQLTEHFEYFTQSISFADYDNDGDLDILLANRNAPLKLFENIGKLHFIDVSEQKEVQHKFLAYGASWGDFDQDGYQDFILTTLGKNYLFWNKKATHFEMDSTSIPENTLSYTTGSAVADLENDGDLDLVLCNLYFPNNVILFNLLDKTSYISIQLICRKYANYEGLGSNLYLFEQDSSNKKVKLVGYRYVRSETGYNSYQLPFAYFGVDSNKTYKLLIKYPGGKSRWINNLTAGNHYVVEDVTQQSLMVQMLTLAQHWVLRKSKRLQIMKIFLLLLLIAGFNLFIRKRTYWPTLHMLFFNTFLLTIFTLVQVFLPVITLNFGWFAPFYLIIVLAVFAFVFIEKYTILKYSEAYQQEIFDLFRQFQHSKNGLAQVDHLIFYCNNFKNLQTKRFWEEFNQEVLFFKNFTIPIIYNVLIKATRLKSMRIYSEKNLRLLKKLERMIAKELNQKTLNDFKQQLLRLKNNLNLLFNEIELQFATPVLKIISQTLNKFNQFTEVKITHPPLAHRLQVVIPGEALSQVLANIFQNAQEAMLAQKEKKLEINIVKDFDKVQIIIKDNGPGIPASLRDKIYEDGFSTKGSSGIGLYHTQKILKRFGGSLQLIEETKEQGAVFKIILKGVDHAQN